MEAKIFTYHGTKELDNLFGEKQLMFPKPSELIKILVQQSLSNTNITLDFFAGSGTTAHAVMKLNKKDNGRRKYILIEMADYFDTVLLPRIKKICYSFNWKDGKPQDTDGISQIIKYQYLEQYEDTLHNIEFPQEEKGQKALELFGKAEEGNEYLMKYFLRYETEESPSLLDLKQFENPFEYKLKIISVNKGEEIVNVDMVETFNYLIGLKVNKYKFMKDNGRKYIFVFGEKGNRRIAIVWRPTKILILRKTEKLLRVSSAITVLRKFLSMATPFIQKAIKS